MISFRLKSYFHAKNQFSPCLPIYLPKVYLSQAGRLFVGCNRL